jgi:translation initiation factor IF-2
MRARGAQVTDIVIIIVAADDDVMPQTIEAINHASAAGVPIIFAINKVDKHGSDPEKIKQQLANMNYQVEDWGGKYQSQDISAKQGHWSSCTSRKSIARSRYARSESKSK